MYDDWPDTTKVLSAQLRNLRGGAPDVMRAFSAIAQTALAPKALDAKTKELIALAIGIAIRCDDCIAFHIKAALDCGATREEISETLGIAIYMGAGPSVMYASHAFAALQQFDAEKTSEPA
jgi:AhpD family alkylhydroperoxidase